MHRGQGEAVCAHGAHVSVRNAALPLPPSAAHSRRPTAPRAHGERHPESRRRRGRRPLHLGVLFTFGAVRAAGRARSRPPHPHPGHSQCPSLPLALTSVPLVLARQRVPLALMGTVASAVGGGRARPRPRRELGAPGRAGRGRGSGPAPRWRVARVPAGPFLPAARAAPSPTARAASRPLRVLSRVSPRPSPDLLLLSFPPAFFLLSSRSKDALGHQPQRKRQQIVGTAAAVRFLRE